MNEAVQIFSEGQRMDGVLCLPASVPPPYPTVIMLPGMTGTNKKYIPLAERLAEKGIAALAVNLRAHGTSEGSMETLTPAGGHADALAVFDFVAARDDIDRTRIGMCGSSYGGMLTALISDERAFRSMLLRAPAAYTERMLQTTYEDLMADESGMFFRIDDLDACPAMQSIRQFRGPLLVVTSEKDVIIPMRVFEKYVSAAGGTRKELKVIEGAPHPLSGPFLDRFATMMEQWFIETL